MVKNPSVFVRHVDIVQDIYIRDEVPYLRVTHLAIDTRLAGGADLTIREHICVPTTVATEGKAHDEPVCSATP
jgi:hypothetical protein